MYFVFEELVAIGPFVFEPDRFGQREPLRGTNLFEQPPIAGTRRWQQI
jgi:hypothetical protein